MNNMLGAKEVNGALGDLLTLRKEPCWVGAVKNAILRRLYVDEVITADCRIVEVYELIQWADFRTMWDKNNLEKLWTPKTQQEAFCIEHPDKLSKNGITFFLRKKDETKPATPDNLFVARVFVYSGGLRVRVDRFEYARVWLAEYAHRLVAPQLAA